MLTSSVISVTLHAREPSPVLPGFPPLVCVFQVDISSFDILSTIIDLCLASLSHLQSSGQDVAHEECVSARGGDDEDPRRPFRQVKGKTVYLEQQEGRKKRRMDRAAQAVAAAAAAAEQADLGDQPQTPSDQIAYRVRRLASRPRSSTHTTASTPRPTLPAPVTPVAPSTTSTTPAFAAPPPVPPIPPARFQERDETKVRPLAADPRLFDLQRATTTRVRRFRYVPVESWLPAQRDPAVVDLFSNRIQESFFRAQMSAQIALRVHRLLDLPAFLLAAGADSEVHLSYLPGLLTLLSTSGRYVEEWVRVFYTTVWIDPDHHWMRFRFEREDVTIHAS
jgi:hypothetical protein